MLDEEVEFEYFDRSGEYIAAAFNSLGAIDLLDTGLMDEDERSIINTIKFQAISIISESLNNIYNEIFDTSTDVNNTDDDNDLVL